jgi:hypothetical protein
VVTTLIFGDQKGAKSFENRWKNGALDSLRRVALYPAELRVQLNFA